jgi:alpha-tubulin suppressor-like RCC1 family protein
MEKCLLKRPTRISFRAGEGNTGSLSHRRRSNATMDDSGIIIEDLKLGEQFSMALSNKGQVFTWGLNDKGQLGHGNEFSSYEPLLISALAQKVVSKIECGLKHCVALTKDYQLYVWGSNLHGQLGKKTPALTPFVNAPILNTAYADAKPFKISCGSYHSVCLSYRMPKIEEDGSAASEENQQPFGRALNQRSQNIEESKMGGAGSLQHDDETCPNMEQVKKLKGELKRLRQELILKGSSKRKGVVEAEDFDSEDSDLDEEERLALRQLSTEQRKFLAELEQSGASKSFVKK